MEKYFSIPCLSLSIYLSTYKYIRIMKYFETMDFETKMIYVINFQSNNEL